MDDHRGENQKYLMHFVVQSGKHIVDTTGAQFGKKYAGIKIYPHKQFKRKWDRTHKWTFSDFAASFHANRH